jgi:hypothetical protein
MRNKGVLAEKKGTSTGGLPPACDGFVHQYFAHTAYLTQTEYSPQ